MFWYRTLNFALALATSVPYVQATTCKAPIMGKLPAPVSATGYDAMLISNDFKYPRGIKFDSEGHLLVIDEGRGVVALVYETDKTGCVTHSTTRLVVADKSLNHGIELSPDGETLYASSMESVWSWPYDAKTTSVDSGMKKTLVTNMTNGDHTTRTLLLSKFVPGMLYVSRGSTANIDPEAEEISSGHSQLRVFNLNNITRAYDYSSSGKLIGWGIRNDVGVDEDPVTGGIYTVENSVDQMHRLGKDIHENNPGEELNFFGTLKNNKSPNQGANFGYPQCYTAWDVQPIPDNKGLKVGMQFAIGSPKNITAEDHWCQTKRVAPRLAFQAHMAPLDILFNTKGTESWITFHGSWDREPPVGYKVAMVDFKNGEPVDPSTSNTAAKDIVTNQDTTHCPNKCFRPVGLAWDSMGRLWFSSDQSGEVYMIMKKGVKHGAINPVHESSSGSGPNSGKGNTGVTQASVSLLSLLGAVATAVLALM